MCLRDIVRLGHLTGPPPRTRAESVFPLMDIVLASLPLIAFLGLVRRRVALVFFVIGRVRCSDDGGARHAPAFNSGPLRQSTPD